MTVKKVNDDVQRFGDKKCALGDAPGRWIYLGDKDCAPPFCTGDRRSTVHSMDWVSH